MSDFGDLEDDDVVDTAPPDPEALARFFTAAQRRLSRDETRPATFDDLHPFERALLLFVFAEVIEKLVREWAKPPL